MPPLTADREQVRQDAEMIDLAELRDAAENNGTSATTVYIGGPPWSVVLALVQAVEALQEFEHKTILGLDPTPPWNALDPFVSADSHPEPTS